jgi:hypothetical protein
MTNELVQSRKSADPQPEEYLGILEAFERFDQARASTTTGVIVATG